jgi:hypothetical protein
MQWPGDWVSPAATQGKMPRFVIALATRSTATMNAAGRVLHAIAGEDLEAAVVHGGQQRDDQRALGRLEEAVHPGSRLSAFAARSRWERAEPRSSWPGLAAFGILSTVTRAAD